MLSAVRYDELGPHGPQNSTNVWGFVRQTFEVSSTLGGQLQYFFINFVSHDRFFSSAKETIADEIIKFTTRYFIPTRILTQGAVLGFSQYMKVIW